MKFIFLPLFWPLYAWLTIASAFPTTTANYDFLHISEKEGLTISISKNSPPLAAIADEALPELKVEPAQAVKVEKNSVYISTGNKSAWPKLQKVSKHFEKEQKRNSLRARQVRVVTRAVSNTRAVQATDVVAPHTRISELINLVHPVNYAVYPPAYHDVRGGTLTVATGAKAVPSVKEAELPTSYLAPLPAPSVDRRLPRGEEAPPTVLDRGPLAKKEQPRQPRVVKNEQINKKTFASEPKEVKSQAIGMDGGGDVSADVYTLLGHVELQGGLAVGVNTLKVEWKTAQEKRPGVVDYTNGQFTIQVPNIKTGKIFATLLDADQNILGQGIFDLNEEDPSKIIIAVEPIDKKIRGSVFSAYSYGNIKIPVPGAEVFAPSQIREMAEKNGAYKVQGLGSDSTFIIEAYAPENWGTRIISESQRMESIPLFSNKMLQSLFDIVGESANNTEYGVIWGEIKKKNNTVAGVKVALSSKGAVGPIYFNELRIPDKNLTATSSNGLFAFIKVPAGLHIVHTQKQNVELPSRVVAAAPSMVSYAEINLRSFTVSGRVYDPQLKQNIPSNISIVGTSSTASSGREGFNVKTPSTDSVLYMNANSGEDYFVSRMSVAKSKAKKVAIPAISKTWLTETMVNSGIKQSSMLGMLLGNVTGQGFSVTLDNEKVSDENIYYFDETGKIENARVDSPESGGMFLLTNLKIGLHTVVISSKDGQTVNTQIVVSETGILNVINLELRH